MLHTLTNRKGRLCNHIYRVLYTYNLSQKDKNNTYEYLPPSETMFHLLKQFGFGEIITEIAHATPEKIRYYQHFGVDFTEDQVYQFTKKFILTSDLYKDSKVFSDTVDQDTSMAIHIRNTDYLNNKFACFDRDKYIMSAFEQINTDKIKNLSIFSDDLKYTYSHFDTLLRSYIPHITYMDGGTTEGDLIRLATFKNKILFNSTYSVWSAIISNTIYPGTEKNIIAPAVCWSSDQGTTIYNPKWNLIPVKITIYKK